jgi:hypothetical protein
VVSELSEMTTRPNLLFNLFSICFNQYEL